MDDSQQPTDPNAPAQDDSNSTSVPAQDNPMPAEPAEGQTPTPAPEDQTGNQGGSQPTGTV